MKSPQHGGGGQQAPNASPAPLGSGANQPGGQFGRGDRVRRDNTLIGKSVSIIQGPMKGRLDCF